MHIKVDFFSTFCYETLIDTDIAVDAVILVLLRRYEHRYCSRCCNFSFP